MKQARPQSAATSTGDRPVVPSPAQDGAARAVRVRGAAPKAKAPVAAPPVEAAPTPSRPAPSRTNDPDRTMQDILEVATKEFADKGLAGARIDEIAASTRTSKRMIYYYFGSKEGLYLAVLEAAYSRIRRIEHGLPLDEMPPMEALRRLTAFTFDYHLANPDFIRLVMIENIHRGEFLAQSKTIQRLNAPVIGAVREIYERGREQGAFREGVDPVDLHMSISALCFYNVSNRHTFSLVFKHDMSARKSIEARRRNVVEMIERYVRA